VQGKRWFKVAGVIVGLLALTLVVGACGDDEEDGGATPTSAGETATEPAGGTPSGSAVDIQLTEYSITANPASVAAGAVTFNAENVGGATHEFVVIKTELDPASLPVKADGSADESAVDVIGEIEEDDLLAGASSSLTVDLEAGTYALICNVVEDSGVSHYAEDMRTGFEVTE
jgi:uncharacterized cupredoxin-like copper-binding protein